MLQTAIQVIKKPAPVGSGTGDSAGYVMVDEGLISSAGLLQPPPPPGEQPKSGADWPSVGYAAPDNTKAPFLQHTSPRIAQ